MKYTVITLDLETYERHVEHVEAEDAGLASANSEFYCQVGFCVVGAVAGHLDVSFITESCFVSRVTPHKSS